MATRRGGLRRVVLTSMSFSPYRCRPEAGDDRKLLLEPIEPLAQRRERNPIGAVLGVVPTCTETELHPATAHRIHLGDGDGERSGQPERPARE